jgi:hypothetical protein
MTLMNELPAATRLAFFPCGPFGSSALPASEAPLKWIASPVASGCMASLRVQTFDFETVRQAHSLNESDRALGKLVVSVRARSSASNPSILNISSRTLERNAEQT